MPGGYKELASIAAWLGVPHDGDASLTFLRDGLQFTISLELNSGSVCGLHVHAARTGLFDVILRREDSVDQRGKERGINVEVQIGDPAFDPKVYIETDAPDQAVRELLASAKARAAILDLLEWCEDVKLSDTGVRVTTEKAVFVEVDHFRGLLERVVEVAALPTVRFSPLATKDESGGALVTLSAFAAPFALGLLVAGIAIYTPESPSIALIGAGVGLAAWLAAKPLFPRLVRGHSKSYRNYRLLFVFSFFDLAVGSAAAAVVANGGLDNSPPDKKVGRIVSVRHYEDDGTKKTETKVSWPRRGEDWHTFEDQSHQLRVGDPVTIVLRRGRFGFPWVQEDYKAYSNTGGKVP